MRPSASAWLRQIIWCAQARALESDIPWARLRAGAYISYCSREQLRPMKPLIPALQAAAESQSFFGPEYHPHIKTNQFMRRLNAQRDTIARLWVLKRVVRRIELS